MSKIFSPNIIFTTSHMVMEDFIKSEETTANYAAQKRKLEEFVKQDGVFSITPETNKNLLSFEMNGGIEGNFDIKLSLIETDGVFEFFLARNSDTTSQMYQSLFRDLWRLNRDSAGDSNVTNTINSQLTRTTIPSTRAFYVAFGIGPDVKRWAGPFTVTLNGATTYLSGDGVREVNLVFTPNDTSFRMNKLEAGLVGTVENSIDAYNNILTTKSWVRSKAVLPGCNYDDFLNDPTQKIWELLKVYLHGIGNSLETIILVPKIPSLTDINSAFQKLKEENEAKIKDLTKKLNPGWTSYDLGLGFANFAKLFSGKSAEQKEIEEEIEKLKQINFNFESINGDQYIQMLKLIKDNVFPQIDVTQDQFSLDAMHEAAPQREITLFDLIMQVDGKEELDEYRSVPDFFRPIKKLSNGIAEIIKKKDGTLAPDDTDYALTIVLESNTVILNMWKEEGWIKRSDEPVIILGPSNIISELFYLSKRANLPESQIVPVLTAELKYLRDEDKKKYFKESYRKKYFDRYFKVDSNSSFGENVLAPDDGIELIGKENINSIPIFRYNISNPNVTGLNILNTPEYFALFSLGFEVPRKTIFATQSPISNKDSIENILSSKAIEALSNKVAEEVIPAWEKDKNTRPLLDLPYTEALDMELGYSSLDETNPIEMQGINLHRKIVNNLNDNKSNPDYMDKIIALNSISDKYGELKEEDLGTIILLKLLRDRLRKNPVIPGVDIEFKSMPPSLVFESTSEMDKTNLIGTMNSMLLNMSIKTIPFFHLAGYGIDGMLCYFTGRRNRIISTDNSKKSEFDATNFLLGYYRINNYKHVITETSMYSEFSLVRAVEFSPIFNQVVKEDVKTGVREAKSINDMILENTKNKKDYLRSDKYLEDEKKRLSEEENRKKIFGNNLAKQKADDKKNNQVVNRDKQKDPTKDNVPSFTLAKKDPECKDGMLEQLTYSINSAGEITGSSTICKNGKLVTRVLSTEEAKKVALDNGLELLRSSVLDGQSLGTEMILNLHSRGNLDNPIDTLKSVKIILDEKLKEISNNTSLSTTGRNIRSSNISTALVMVKRRLEILGVTYDD